MRLNDWRRGAIFSCLFRARRNFVFAAKWPPLTNYAFVGIFSIYLGMHNCVAGASLVPPQMIVPTFLRTYWPNVVVFINYICEHKVFFTKKFKTKDPSFGVSVVGRRNKKDRVWPFVELVQLA